MTKFETSYEILQQAEYDKDPSQFLHRNEGEDGLTVGGVYQKYFPYDISWDMLNALIELNGGDINEASRMASVSKNTQKEVCRVFKYGFWDSAKLDDVESDRISNAIFLIGTNIGMTESVKIAQTIVSTTVDGIVGIKTLKALNEFDEDLFIQQFKELAIRHYRTIVSNDPSKEMFLDGWINRVGMIV